jgi:DNA-binding transcriptional ArsR family regulator
MLRALADETRRQILGLVSRRERAAGEIAARFTLTRPAISQHLALLLRNGLIAVRRAGTRRLYRANPRAVARLRAELESFWDESLFALKDAAEAHWTKKRRKARPRAKI